MPKLVTHKAFRPQPLIEISAALVEAREDERAGVIIWTGEGARAFCSGGDQRVRGDSGYKTDEGPSGLFLVTDLHLQARLRPDTQLCDHCGTKRNRASTYLLQDGVGEVKRVGLTQA